MTYAAHGSGKGCTSRPANRRALAEKLHEDDGMLEDGNIRPGRNSPGDHESTTPDSTTRLDRLPAKYPARPLLARPRLGRGYRVGDCGESDVRLARERVIAL